MVLEAKVDGWGEGLCLFNVLSQKFETYSKIEYYNEPHVRITIHDQFLKICIFIILLPPSFYCKAISRKTWMKEIFDEEFYTACHGLSYLLYSLSQNVLMLM